MILPQNLHLKLRKSVKSRRNFGNAQSVDLVQQENQMALFARTTKMEKDGIKAVKNADFL